MTLHRKFLFCGLFAVLVVATMPAGATYNATITGTVQYVQQIGPGIGYTPETFTFRLNNQPTIACTSGFQQFIVSPGSINDAQTRKNMLAVLLTAKASGASVTVAYDDAGGYCDQGMPAIYYVTVL